MVRIYMSKLKFLKGRSKNKAEYRLLEARLVGAVCAEAG